MKSICLASNEKLSLEEEKEINKIKDNEKNLTTQFWGKNIYLNLVFVLNIIMKVKIDLTISGFKKKKIILPLTKFK